jgi:mRNA-degrading endonuclease YafQ of YafQ-DinJ toxin-antitoxin module
MRTMFWDDSFRNALKRSTRIGSPSQIDIMTTLAALERDPFQPSLKIHKLQGELKGLWACFVDQDCRIIFVFKVLKGEDEAAIVLIDIGTRDEVY